MALTDGCAAAWCRDASTRPTFVPTKKCPPEMVGLPARSRIRADVRAMVDDVTVLNPRSALSLLARTHLPVLQEQDTNDASRAYYHAPRQSESDGSPDHESADKGRTVRLLALPESVRARVAPLHLDIVAGAAVHQFPHPPCRGLDLRVCRRMRLLGRNPEGRPVRLYPFDRTRAKLPSTRFKRAWRSMDGFAPLHHEIELLQPIRIVVRDCLYLCLVSAESRKCATTSNIPIL